MTRREPGAETTPRRPRTPRSTLVDLREQRVKTRLLSLAVRGVIPRSAAMKSARGARDRRSPAGLSLARIAPVYVQARDMPARGARDARGCLGKKAHASCRSEIDHGGVW